MIFDTHAHYDDEAFDDDREKLLERMQNRGVEYVVNVGASMSSCKSTIGLVRRFPYVYGALGVHPDEVSELTEEDYQWLKKSIYKPKIVAVGEIGLDYHWNDNKEQQIEWFEKQMDIAREAELPIIIHSRDAANDTYLNKILMQMKSQDTDLFWSTFQNIIERVLLNIVVRDKNVEPTIAAIQGAAQTGGFQIYFLRSQ